MKKIPFLLLLPIIAFLPASSQDFGDIMQAGAADAETYFEKYTGPVMASFTNGLGAGWYNTGKPHKLLGFDLTATVNIANIPSGERMFDFQSSDFQNLVLQNSNTNQLPTVVGGAPPNGSTLLIPAGVPVDVGGETITYEFDQEFPVPEGIDAESLPVVGFPVPVVQLGIGLPKNTDLKVRYLAVDIEDASVSLFGIGAMHDLKQWIPGLKQIPFDFSGFIGYTTFSAEFDFNSTSGDFRADGVTELSATSFTLQGVVSKTLPVITPYVGIGFVVGSSSKSIPK